MGKKVAVDYGERKVEIEVPDSATVVEYSDPELLAELSEREPSVRTVHADARAFSVDTQFPLVIAPMSLVQILGGHRGRVAMLRRVHAHLSPEGLFAAPISDPSDAVPEELIPPPLPDILERDGWVFSSQPLSMYEEDGCVVIERRRQSNDRPHVQIGVRLSVQPYRGS